MFSKDVALKKVDLAIEFKDTMYMIKSNQNLLAETKKMARESKVYSDYTDTKVLTAQKKGDGLVEVVAGTSFDTARSFVMDNAEDKVTVLNFANAFTPWWRCKKWMQSAGGVSLSVQ